MEDDDSLKAIFRGSSPARGESLSDEVLVSFRKAIVRGELKPGYRLSEPTLAEAFGVSRGPVREALARLQQEGLVRIERHKGARVVQISREDAEELYELRTDLERLAVKRACRLISSDELAGMQAIVSRYEGLVRSGTTEEAVDLDMEFHDAIYRAAHHERLYTCWSSLLRSQIYAFVFSRSVVDPGYMIPCIFEHAAIHEAIKDRDGGRAAELVAHHLHTAYERLVRTSVEEES